MPGMAVEFGRNLKRLREQKGETQATVAYAIGTDAGSVSRWERGVALPQLEQVYKLAEHFGVKPGALLVSDVADLEGPEPEAFTQFRSTRLGKIAEQNGWLGYIRAIDLPFPPTVDIYHGIAAAMLREHEQVQRDG